VAAILWQVLACVGLAIAAANIFPGIGLALVLIAVITWLGVPLWRLIRYLIRHDNIELPSRLRFFAITGFGLGLASLLLLAPAPPTIRAPIVVRQDLLSVRAKADGRIAKFHFESGQRVKRGDLLITLVNPELEKQLQQSEIDLRSVRAQTACHLSDGDIELLQLAQEHLQGLQNRHQELRYLVTSLELRAEVDGIVLLSNALTLTGQFVHSGEELLSICQSDTCRAVALVAQSDARWLRTTEGHELWVLLWGQGGTRIPSTVTQVFPRASFDLPHAAFASTLGGEISVLDRQQANSGRDNRADSLLASGSQHVNRSLADSNHRAGAETTLQAASGRASQSLGAVASGLRTVQPYVQVEVTIMTEMDQRIDSHKLFDGQTGILCASSRRTNLGSYLAESLGGWLREQFTISHGL
jgi:hypothetical protein